MLRRVDNVIERGTLDWWRQSSVRVLALDDAAVHRFMTRLGLDGARATELVEVVRVAAD